MIFSIKALLISALVALPTPNQKLGDVNRDGVINLQDVAPFVDRLIAGEYQFEADINQDGSVNLLDVAPFIEVLTTDGGDSEPEIVPLYDSATELEPPTTTITPDALITIVGDRVRDRHAREDIFQAYGHYLEFYWEQRTVAIEIIDRIAMGGNSITVNAYSMIPLHTRDFRAFFRGLNTPAEYFHNVGMTQVSPTHYSTTLTFNAKTGQPIRIGDRMEFEFSPFLSNPTNGRDNYYGTAFLYIVGDGFKPWEGVGPILDSFPLPEETWLGGRTTIHQQYSDEPDNLLKQMAGNMAPISTQPFVLGRRLHHTDFGNGSHSEQPNPNFVQHAGKLGPKYVAQSCVSCHIENGRSFAPSPGSLITQSVVKVAIDDCGTPHPDFGSVLQPRSINGTSEPRPMIEDYSYIDGQYGDGTAYQLRRPNYSFAGAAPPHFSVRIAAPLVGMGLLEAIDESTIVAFADPNDGDNDGISGRIQIVTDPETGQPRLGRFGFKSGQAKLVHQIAAALNTDIGVTSTIFPHLDGENGSGSTELNDVELSQMTRYVGTLGVNPQRNYDDADVISGSQIFNTIGCADCHKPNVTTGQFHPWTELREQVIHPFTDMLLHDMGPGLADNLGEGVASGAEWRTTPLWGIGSTSALNAQEGYLHDGRARDLSEAILWHGGEGENAKNAFANLPAAQRGALIEFLKSL